MLATQAALNHGGVNAADQICGTTTCVTSPATVRTQKTMISSRTNRCCSPGDSDRPVSIINDGDVGSGSDCCNQNRADLRDLDDRIKDLDRELDEN